MKFKVIFASVNRFIDICKIYDMSQRQSIVSFLVFVYCLIIGQFAFSQKTDAALADRYNVISHAVPFLVISPDSRAGAMGDIGAATEPDVWSMHWNPSKYSFAKKDFGGGISYIPWLRNLQIKDVSETYLTGYKRIDKRQTVAMSVQYFNLGNIDFTNSDGLATGQSFSPREFAIDAAFSRLLSKDFAFSIALRYINSNLTGGVSSTPGELTHAAQTVASDVSGYYQKQTNFGGIPTEMRFGFNISNLGGKISYNNSGSRDYLPATLRLGAGTTLKLDEFNDLGINFEASKLLVPTRSYTDSAGVLYGIAENEKTSSTSAAIQSFYDAPGGIKEEWHEIMWGVGLEYWYVKQFALRGGYFYEDKSKGNRKIFTVGVGLRMSVMGFDAAYIIPVAGSNSPLANTWRISITFDIDKPKVQTQPQKI